LQIVLIRHGATDWNLEHRCQGSSDRELSPEGMRQAEAIAELLCGESLAAIYASDLKRARRTAEVIGQPHHLPVRLDESMRELDHGELEGLTFDEIKLNFGEFLTRWRSEPAELQVPGGERLIDVAERAWMGLQHITKRHTDDDNIVVVSHHFPIVGIVCRITGTPLNHYRDFHLDPCGVSRLHCNTAGRWRVSHVNGQEYPSSPEARRDAATD